MAGTHRSPVASKFTHARDPWHTNARALSHVLTECPPQVRGDERGEARANDQHAVQQQFIHPGADRLPHFLDNMLPAIPVKTSDDNRNGIAIADSASAGSLAQRHSSQPAFNTALSARSKQVCFTTQNGGECLSSASRHARITDRSAQSVSYDALTDAIHRSALWYVLLLG